MSRLRTEDDAREVGVDPQGRDTFVVRVGETSHTVKVIRSDGASVELELAGGRRLRAFVARDRRGLFVFTNGKTTVFTREEPQASERRGARGGHDKGLEAPMPGQIRVVVVTEGAEVAEGDALVVLEAMKMELHIRAPRAGKVAKVLCKVGDVVDRGQVLVELGPAGAQ